MDFFKKIRCEVCKRTFTKIEELMPASAGNTWKESIL